MNVKILLSGCDDSTEIKVDISEHELFFLRRLEELFSEASTNQCMPTLHVEEVEGE